MDTWHGRVPDDPSHHLTGRHPLLRLRHLRSDGHHRHLHGRTGGCCSPPLPRHRHGARQLREGGGERGRRGERDNFPDDVLGRNLLATRDTARYHEAHSQLHATNVCERWTQRRVDLCGTSPSSYQYNHSARPSSVLHSTRQPANELERRIVPRSSRSPQPTSRTASTIALHPCGSWEMTLRRAIVPCPIRYSANAPNCDCIRLQQLPGCPPNEFSLNNMNARSRDCFDNVTVISGLTS